MIMTNNNSGMNKKPSLLPTPHSSPSSSSVPTAHKPEQRGYSDKGPLRRQSTPGERLAQRRVKADTTRVLLGDSIFVPLKPELMYPESAAENISVSGLAVHELCHWLANIPKCPNVIQCVIHVGINTCGITSTSVPECEWSSLIKLAKKTFPNADISLSSIIPPKSGEPILKQSVTNSNAALKTCCAHMNCNFIDNNIIFKTANGAPRKALYRDNVHPSNLGTGRLACHIKNGGEPFIPRTHHHEQYKVNQNYQPQYVELRNHTPLTKSERPVIMSQSPSTGIINHHQRHPPPPYLNAIRRRADPQFSLPQQRPIHSIPHYNESIYPLSSHSRYNMVYHPNEGTLVCECYQINKCLIHE